MSSFCLTRDRPCSDWQQFPYILSGYRKDITSYREAARTLFTIHNETANIWTMIMLFFMAAGLFAYTIAFGEGDIVPFALFFCASAIHLPFSVGYHLFLPISNEVKTKWRNLDITFIFISATLFALAFGYSVLDNSMLLLLGAVCSGVTTHGVYIIRTRVVYDRVLVCKLIGVVVVCYLFPMYYHAFAESDLLSFYLAVGTTVVMGASAIAYKDCIPERFAPGKYDLIGNSHNIMHLGLIVAYVIEYAFIWHVARLCVAHEIGVARA